MDKIVVNKIEMVDGQMVLTLAEPIDTSQPQGEFVATEHQLHKAIDRCQDVSELDVLADEIKAYRNTGKLNEDAMARLEKSWETRDTYLSNLKQLHGARKR